MYYVYLYYIGNILVYIGKSTGNPYMRYWNHVKKEHTWQSGCFSAVNKVGIIYFDSQAEMEICELFLIVTRKPLWNTKDVYPMITPEIKVSNIPDEKLYSVEEFLVRYGNKNANKLQLLDISDSDIDLAYYKEKQLLQCRTTRPGGCMYLYYAGEELMYISSSVGYLKHKQFVAHFENLSQNGANFAIVDRIDLLSFSTNAEANIYEKYCMATKHPLWMSDKPLWNCKCEICVENPSVIESLPKEQVEILCKEMDDNIRRIRDKSID